MSEAEWKETWFLFDEKRTGQVAKTDFIHIVRSLGRKYTEAEIQEKTKAIGDPVSLDEFIGFMKQPYDGPTKDDLLQALKAFDGNETGFLKVGEITSLLTTLGEKMSEAEVQQLMQDVKPDGEGKVNIEQFADYLCEPVPSMTPNIEELQKQLQQGA
eukprot:Hpha_TRINITY_DN16728_c0_g1::TRINITY_DN16728_c0_g1_i1::g.78342::m.78342/K02183/CALM; calmodulin